MNKPLDELKKNLPKGWTRKAANDLNLSATAVNLIVNGKLPFNNRVISYLVDMAEKNVNEKKHLEERIKNLGKIQN